MVTNNQIERYRQSHQPSHSLVDNKRWPTVIQEAGFETDFQGPGKYFSIDQISHAVLKSFVYFLHHNFRIWFHVQFQNLLHWKLNRCSVSIIRTRVKRLGGTSRQQPAKKAIIHQVTTLLATSKGASGLVDRALDSISEGLGFDSQCWPCVEVLGKLRIPHCLSPPSRNGYLVHKSKVGTIAAGCIGAHLTRGKVKSVEYALSWGLDSKQLLLPLPSKHVVFPGHNHLLTTCADDPTL